MVFQPLERLVRASVRHPRAVSFDHAAEQLELPNGTGHAVILGILIKQGVLQVAAERQISYESLKSFIRYMSGKGYVYELLDRIFEEHKRNDPDYDDWLYPRLVRELRKEKLVSSGLVEVVGKKSVGNVFRIYPIAKETELVQAVLTGALAKGSYVKI